ncbi:MAG: TIGR03621 family F420-dependent LLM class oxidoreductase [Ilumatobacteraceae bacterium]|jgi:probable F420-dependent oxidoreductase|nr:TIGR03621 family F420-dependent LLM class oxidoreductase [Actinomycetota bacterium]MDA3012461.1 TIGR03621 family F420-dependent LLM class oxidoreductase [Actinomycetota bacterium]MDA3025334.1 TIGR03621 family F420-dependent LLM class oxidoreductase [Actinomycetota bacterium]
MTSSPRPFRFGVQASGSLTGTAWMELARRVEGNGYSTLTMPDHFDDQLAPVPALTAAAAVTDTLRVGALVWDNDYKHPLVLAKELATMDVLSNGRVEIGLGAGWMIADYEQSGMPYDRAGVRIDRFVEGLAVIRGLMGPDPFSYDGEHYRITNHNGTPKPVQGPCPPILIGGGGKRVLSIAAREADIIGINATMSAGVIGPQAFDTMTAAAVDEKVAIVREAGAHRFDDIEMNIRAFLVNIADDSRAAAEAIGSMIGVAPELVESTPFALVGPTSKIVDDLLERRERWGFSYVIVGMNDVESFAPVVAALNGR